MLSTVKLGPTDMPASTPYGKVLLLERSQNDTIPRVSLEGFPVPTVFLKQLLLQVILCCSISLWLPVSLSHGQIITQSVCHTGQFIS